MIDSHAHLQDEKFNNVSNIICSAQKNGVNTIVCASSSIKTSKMAVGLANQHQQVFATIGIHPEEAIEWSEQNINLLKQLAKNKKVVAIGETGLDYYYQFCSKEVQKQAFIGQIKLANELNLPLVVHSRDASKDTMDILKQHISLLKNGVVIHCFSMSLEILKEVEKLGFYISLGGAITFKNARGLLDIAKNVNLNRLMLETDSPYMSPEPFRGKVNEPKNVLYVAKKIAELKNTTLKEIDSITTQNTKNFFRI